LSSRMTGDIVYWARGDLTFFFLPPHPNPPPQGGREKKAPSPLVGEGWGGGGIVPHSTVPSIPNDGGEQMGYRAASYVGRKIGLPKTRDGRYTPPSLVGHPRGPIKATPTPEGFRCRAGPALRRHGRQGTTAEFCCVLGFAGMPALPTLLGRGDHLAGPSGFWVGHSSECFTVELMSDREPGLRARLPGIRSAGAETGSRRAHSPAGMRKRTPSPRRLTFRLLQQFHQIA
jgi:hypothetical protein